jgi:organic hydroperoxide reductase OsmC/OhrA
MPRDHRYKVAVVWTGNRGVGTKTYRAYDRNHEASASGKPVIAGSSDPSFQGDPARWNPEELLVASLAACHKLWYLHLCADAGVVVTAYEDHAEGIMVEEDGGEGQFASVVLRPEVTISADSDAALARRLHETAHEKCFIARSVSFPVSHRPLIVGARETVSS